jgi:small subunit ribosomal protein S13
MAKTPPRKKEEEPKPVKKKPKIVVEEKEGFRGIVRIAGKDIRGHVPLERGILRVRGIGHSLAAPVANVLAAELKIKKDMKVGELTDAQIESIDSILFNLQKYSLPAFMLNRNSDPSVGENRHVIMNDLLFALREDIEREKKTYSWRGYRHAYGQRVRGQKTRNTGRKGMAVGVLRKSVIAAHKGASKDSGKDKSKK